MVAEPVVVSEYIDDLQIGHNNDSNKLLEVKKTIQKYHSYEEEEWPEEKIKKLLELVKKTNDFQYIGYYIDLSPGSCYRQYCSLFTRRGLWKLYEDIQLLSFLKEGISDPNTISDILISRKSEGIKNRIDRLTTHNLHNFDLYFGPFQIPCEEVIEITTKIESLNFESSIDSSSIIDSNIESSKNDTNKNDTNNINKSNKQKLDEAKDEDNKNKSLKNKEKEVNTSKDENSNIPRDEKLIDKEDTKYTEFSKSKNKSIDKKDEISNDQKDEKPTEYGDKESTEIKKKKDELINQKEENSISSKKETKVIKKCTLNYYKNHVKRMIERDTQIYNDYYENDRDRKNDNIKDDIDNIPTFNNIRIQVLDALRNCDGCCPYCHREIQYLEYQQSFIGWCPTSASFDHIIPGMVTFNGDTKLQVTCQQCNFGKSNATDMEYRYYLQSIKDFHNKKNDETRKKEFTLHKTHELEAWREYSNQRLFTGVNTKAVKNRNTDYKTDIINGLIDQINAIDLDDNTKNSQKSDEEKDDIPKILNKEEERFFKLIRTIGYRDPTTGALGIWDSSWQISRRFTLIKCKYSYNIVTGIKLPWRAADDKEVVLKFTKDVRYHYKADEFYSWLSTIKNHDGDFI